MAGVLADIRRQLPSGYQVTGSEAGISFRRSDASGSNTAPVVNHFTDNGLTFFARGTASSLTLTAGDLTVQVGDAKSVDITGSFQTPEALARAVQGKVAGVVTFVNQDTGALEISSAKKLTVGGAEAGSSGQVAFTAADYEPEGSLEDASVRDWQSARKTVLRIDAALDTLSAQRARFGATLSRFESIVGSLQGNEEVIGAARGRIVDADYASESARLTSSRVLRDAGMAVLAMVNVGPRSVLDLLRPG